MTDTTNGQAFYKGFDENMQCRGFQYVEGETYVHEGRVNVCHSGFHACESPLDTLSYYPPSNSVYRQVQLEGVKKSEGGDSKVAGRKIKIGAKLSLMDLAKLHVDFVMENVKPGDYSAATNTGDRFAATNTGDYSAATNTGDRSAATNTGHYSAATNTGDHSAATNTGYHSAATNTGYQSAATNTGYHSAATNTGDRSAATNTGYQSAATNTGDYSAATVSGKDSIAVVTGYASKARGARGCWIVLTERDPHSYTIKEVRAVCVDGETVKAGVFYTLQDGELVEVGE